MSRKSLLALALGLVAAVSTFAADKKTGKEGKSAVVTEKSAKAPGKKIEAGKYDIDPMHSKVGFEVTHLMIQTVDGRFKTFSGVLNIDEKFENSKLEASVDIGSIDTGTEKRDSHLKSADFFDAEKFPKMTFKSTGITGNEENFKLTGDLTIKGTTKKVVFDTKFTGAAVDGYGNLKVAFTASAKVSRKDFDLKWNQIINGGPIVGDEVTIELRIQAGRPAVAKK